MSRHEGHEGAIKRRIADSPESGHERTRRPFTGEPPLESASQRHPSNTAILQPLPPPAPGAPGSTPAQKKPADTAAMTENALRPDRGGTEGRLTEVRANFFPIHKVRWLEPGTSAIDSIK